MAKSLAVPAARKGMPSPKLRKAEFLARYLEQFRDQGFDAVRGELDGIAAIAWEAYRCERKSPQTRKAGKGFADPDYDLSVDWLAAHAAVEEARKTHARKDGPCRILIVNGSA
jgi:hypothetical protein